MFFVRSLYNLIKWKSWKLLFRFLWLNLWFSPIYFTFWALFTPVIIIFSLGHILATSMEVFMTWVRPFTYGKAADKYRSQVGRLHDDFIKFKENSSKAPGGKNAKD